MENHLICLKHSRRCEKTVIYFCGPIFMERALYKFNMRVNIMIGCSSGVAHHLSQNRCDGVQHTMRCPLANTIKQISDDLSVTVSVIFLDLIIIITFFYLLKVTSPDY